MKKLFLLALILLCFTVNSCEAQLPVGKINGVPYSTVNHVNGVQMGTVDKANTARLDIPLLRGFSGYPYGGNSDIDEIILNMTNYGANCWRVSFNPIGLGGTRPYNLSLVTYFLDNTPDDWYVIVDCNHYVDAYAPNNYPTNQTLAQERVADVLSTYPNNTRVLVEFWNEPAWSWNTTFYAPIWIDNVRNSSYTGKYTNGLVVTKFCPYFLPADIGHGFYQPWRIYPDAYNRTWQGFHAYNTTKPPRPYTGTHGLSFQDTPEYMGNASIKKGVLTEIGAEGDEAPFSQANVDAVNFYMNYLANSSNPSRVYGYTVWIHGNPKDIPVNNGYDDRGLTSPLP